jgi:hypothetical protein
MIEPKNKSGDAVPTNQLKELMLQDQPDIQADADGDDAEDDDDDEQGAGDTANGGQ